jgi:hypothetical protein
MPFTEQNRIPFLRALFHNRAGFYLQKQTFV